MGKYAYQLRRTMRKQDVIHHFGSVSAVASALGITSQAVSMWPDTVPQMRQYEIERLTHGRLKADTPKITPAVGQAQRA